MGVIYITHHVSKKHLRSLFLVAVVLQVVPVLKLHPYYATYHFSLFAFTRGVGCEKHQRWGRCRTRCCSRLPLYSSAKIFAAHLNMAYG